MPAIRPFPRELHTKALPAVVPEDPDGDEDEGQEKKHVHDKVQPCLAPVREFGPPEVNARVDLFAHPPVHADEEHESEGHPGETHHLSNDDVRFDVAPGIAGDHVEQ